MLCKNLASCYCDIACSARVHRDREVGEGGGDINRSSGVQPRGESFPPRLTEETRISRHNQNHRQVVNNSCDVQYSTSTMEQDQKRLQELSEALQKFQDGV